MCINFDVGMSYKHDCKYLQCWNLKLFMSTGGGNFKHWLCVSTAEINQQHTCDVIKLAIRSMKYNASHLQKVHQHTHERRKEGKDQRNSRKGKCINHIGYKFWIQRITFLKEHNIKVFVYMYIDCYYAVTRKNVIVP